MITIAMQSAAAEAGSGEKGYSYTVRGASAISTDVRTHADGSVNYGRLRIGRRESVPRYPCSLARL